MSVLNKPKSVTVRFSLESDQFTDENWEEEISSELYTIGKMGLEDRLYPGTIKGNRLYPIGHVDIEYDDSEEAEVDTESASQQKTPKSTPHKAKFEVCFEDAAFGDDWRNEYADTLIALGANIKRRSSIQGRVTDINGNVIGSVEVSP